MSETNSAGENARTDRDAPHNKKPDAEESARWDPTEPVDLSEFVPLDMANNIDDERTKQRITWVDGLGRAYADSRPTTEVVTDGGTDLPKLVYNDAAISTGDIVVDLSSGKALQVVGKSVQTVGEHPQTRSDATAAMFDADADEPVFDCVFLPDGEKVSPPTKTYAYPESRLLRYPVEDATEYDGDIQTWLRTAFLDELAEAAAENDRLTAAVSKAVREAYGEDLEATFRAIVESKSEGEREAATDGGTEVDR